MPALGMVTVAEMSLPSDDEAITSGAVARSGMASGGVVPLRLPRQMPPRNSSQICIRETSESSSLACSEKVTDSPEARFWLLRGVNDAVGGVVSGRRVTVTTKSVVAELPAASAAVHRTVV